MTETTIKVAVKPIQTAFAAVAQQFHGLLLQLRRSRPLESQRKRLRIARWLNLGQHQGQAQLRRCAGNGKYGPETSLEVAYICQHGNPAKILFVKN